MKLTNGSVQLETNDLQLTLPLYEANTLLYSTVPGLRRQLSWSGFAQEDNRNICTHLKPKDLLVSMPLL